MKRILALMLAAACMLSVAGCGSAQPSEKERDEASAAYLVRKAEYPEMAPYPDEADYYDEKSVYFDDLPQRIRFAGIRRGPFPEEP